MSLASRVSHEFYSYVRDRGAEYFRQGRARILEGNRWHVASKVQGGKTYDVELSLEDDQLLVECSCPYFDANNQCKHVWAAILESDNRGFLGGDGRRSPLRVTSVFEEIDETSDFEDESGDEEVRFDEKNDWGKSWQQQPATHPAQGKQPNWKSLLTGVDESGSTAWPPTRRLIYIIDVQETVQSQLLTLHVMPQDRKKNGEWSKPRKQGILRSQLDDLPEQIDREILAMIAGSSGQTSYNYYGYQYHDTTPLPVSYRLTGHLPPILMPLLARTQRCFLDSTIDQPDATFVTWDAGEAWQFFVEVRRLKPPEDHYEIKGILRRGSETIDPASIVLLLRNGILFTKQGAALLDHNNAFQWISSLRKYGVLRVPGKQIDEFMKQVLSKSQIPRLDLPEELRYEQVALSPQPHLVFQKPQHSDRLSGRLQFVYTANCTFQQDDPRQGSYDATVRKYFVRDRSSEQRRTQELTDQGARVSVPDYYRKESSWQIAPTRFPRAVRELTAAGWHIEAEGKIFRSAGKINISVSSGIDWFELHGEIAYGEISAKLPELLAAVRRGDTMVNLDDGTYGVLPEEWLKKYGLIAGLGQSYEDHLRFRKTQVGILDALLAAQPEITLDETFTTARSELMRFQGIEPLEPPPEFHGMLRLYQKEALGWMSFLRQFGFGGCLADDMGLGKTVTVLALLLERRQIREQAGEKNGAGSRPSLIVVPKSLVFNWIQEASRFTPDLRLLDHTGQFRQKATDHFQDYDVIMTTYGTLRNDAVLFNDVEFDYIILDEAQSIKNADTASAKAARLLKSNHRLALSGTPVQNHLGDLWSLFEFLNPGMLGAASVFKLAGPVARNPDEETRKILAQALRPFILRRTKDQVAKELPRKFEQTIFCEMDAGQRKLYNELREHYRTRLMKRIEVDGMAKSKILVLEALLRLRQAACHPGLIDKAKVDTETSAKLEMLLPQLAAVLEEGHKALVFSQFTSFLAILRRHLDRDGVPYEYLDGQTTDRQARVERFQGDPDCKLFLVSLKAGGLGLNLTAAEYVYLLDPWWNPVIEAQAIDRAHRIGQTRQVFAYRIIARDTVEEKVLQLQETKRNLADAIINADNSLIRDLAREDLDLLLS